jgi:hypothetical protein
LRVSQKNSEFRTSVSRSSGSFATPVAPSNRVNQHITLEQYGYPPFQYGYLQTPPYPYYVSPWGYHYGGNTPYGPPSYPGFATGSPAPTNPQYYATTYPSPEYQGQYYPQGQAFGYGFAPQGPMVETVQEEQSQAPILNRADQIHPSTEDHDFNAQ